MAIEVNSPPRLGYEPVRRRAPREKSGGDDLDWLALGRTLWRRKFFLVGLILLVLAVTAAWVSRLPPQYEAESLVMFNERQTRVADIPEVVSALPPQEEGLQAQFLLVESRAMAEQLMQDLQLHLLPVFNPTLRPRTGGLAEWLDPLKWIPVALLDRLPRAWADNLMTATSPVAMTDQQQAALLRGEIINNVLKSISAEPASAASVMRLQFVSTDPELAKMGADTLARLYLSQQLESKQSVARGASEFLNEEIQRLRASVEQAESAISSYREQTGLLEGPEPIDAQQMTQLNTQLVIAQSERAQAEARLRQVESLVNSDVAAAAQMLDSGLLDSLRTREAELNREIAELSQEYGARHPQMVAARAELDSLEDRMDREIRQIAGRLRDEVAVLRAREAALQSNIDRLKGQLTVRNKSEIELEALQREANADRELLETYLNRQKQIESQYKSQQPDARVIANAVVPDDPTYPQRLLIFGIAFAGATLFGSLMVFGLESLDNTFRSSEQIEDQIGLPTLGFVPLITGYDKRYSQPEDLVLDAPNSPFGESVRSLRTAVLLTNAGTAPNSVLLTSSVPGEGKTSIAMCLARISAHAGRKTLLVDCDLRRPRLHELTGIANQQGLSDVLLRQRELDEVLLSDDRSGASFVTAGPPVPDPAALLASEEMRRLLKDVTGRFDLVILDSPPVLSVSDARVLSQMADKTVFLVHWGSTRRHDVMMGVKQLIEAGADMGGIVLSRVNVKKHAKYGYRDSGYYYDDKYTKYYSTG